MPEAVTDGGVGVHGGALGIKIYVNRIIIVPKWKGGVRIEDET